MYAVISNGTLVALCEKPRYIKIKEETGVFVEANADEALGVSVNGTVYNLPGCEILEGAPTAYVSETDAGVVATQQQESIEKLTAVQDYIAMMADIDLDTEEDTTEEDAE